LVLTRGCARKDEDFALELVLGSEIDILAEARWKGSLFILGTNDLDTKELKKVVSLLVVEAQVVKVHTGQNTFANLEGCKLLPKP
jgi:hypothetical protein